jgi:hypothetical protein
MISSTFPTRASPGLEEGKGAIGIVETEMVKRVFQHSVKERY